MPSVSHYINGISLYEIDAVAQEILNVLEENGIPRDVASLALCRSIVEVNFDLDNACRVIDDLSTAEDLPPLTYTGGEHADDYSSGEE